MKCYEVLNISSNASPQEITQVYRDLVKVWNPERFMHDPALQEKAQNMLKTIDEAFDSLMTDLSKSKTENNSTQVLPTIEKSIECNEIEKKDYSDTPQPVPIPPSAIAFFVCFVLLFVLSVRFPNIGHAATEGGLVFLTWWVLLSIIAFMVALVQKAQNKKPYLSMAFWTAFVFGILYGTMCIYSPAYSAPQPLHNAAVSSQVKLTTAEEMHLKKIIQGVMTKPDYLNEDVHREFWKIIERNGKVTSAQESELLRQVREKITYALTTYMKHYFADALITLRTGKPYKSPKRAQDEARMLADGGLTSERIKQNEALLQKIAKNEPIERNGQKFTFNEAMIKAAISQLDGASARITILFTKP